MKFKKSFLTQYREAIGGRTISDEIISHGRWSVTHERIFEHEGHYYRTTYRVGATEYQDESPYEYEGDEIECEEVFPVVRSVTAYEPITGLYHPANKCPEGSRGCQRCE